MRHCARLYLFLILSTFSCCVDVPISKLEIDKDYSIKFEDTFYSKPTKISCKKCEFAYYPLVYIGDKKPRIYVTDSVDFENHYYENYGYAKGSLPYAPKVDIFVDTEQIIYRRYIKRKIYNGSINYYSAKGVQFENDTILNYVSSYPVIVTNKLADTISIGSDEHLNCILEAKNKEGKWCSIEKQKIYFCGTSMSGMFLAPNEVAITSVIIYQGSYRTQCRLRLNNSLSNEFNCNININQFCKNEYE